MPWTMILLIHVVHKDVQVCHMVKVELLLTQRNLSMTKVPTSLIPSAIQRLKSGHNVEAVVADEEHEEAIKVDTKIMLRKNTVVDGEVETTEAEIEEVVHVMMVIPLSEVDGAATTSLKIVLSLLVQREEEGISEEVVVEVIEAMTIKVVHEADAGICIQIACQIQMILTTTREIKRMTKTKK